MTTELELAISELVHNMKRQANMISELEESVCISTLWPSAVWPVYTCIVKKGREYKFRLRDATGATRLIAIRKVPSLLLASGPIRELAETSTSFRRCLEDAI